MHFITSLISTLLGIYLLLQNGSCDRPPKHSHFVFLETKDGIWSSTQRINATKIAEPHRISRSYLADNTPEPRDTTKSVTYIKPTRHQELEDDWKRHDGAERERVMQFLQQRRENSRMAQQYAYSRERPSYSAYSAYSAYSDDEEEEEEEMPRSFFSTRSSQSRTNF